MHSQERICSHARGPADHAPDRARTRSQPGFTRDRRDRTPAGPGTRVGLCTRAGALLLGNLCLGLWTGAWSPGRVAAAEQLEKGPRVIVAEAEPVAFPLTVEALGNAVANESVEIRPRISQAITAIRFTEGQQVEAGDVLVELEAAEALAQVAAAKAALVESARQFKRAEELLRTNAVAPTQLEQAAARRDADQAALDAALARKAETVIRAPFAGRLGLRRVSLGSLVSPDTVITTLDDTDTIKVDFDVPETAIARLQSGLAIVARSAAWPDERFEGSVTTVDTRVDPISRTVAVRGQIPNAEGKLRPGMFLSVKLLREDVQSLVIPEEAIVPEQSLQFVWVVNEENRISRRQIRTGRRRPGEVEILEGLRAGERVVVEGTQKVREGGSVQIVDTPRASLEDAEKESSARDTRP